MLEIPNKYTKHQVHQMNGRHTMRVTRKSLPEVSHSESQQGSEPRK